MIAFIAKLMEEPYCMVGRLAKEDAAILAQEYNGLNIVCYVDRIEEYISYKMQLVGGCALLDHESFYCL